MKQILRSRLGRSTSMLAALFGCLVLLVAGAGIANAEVVQGEVVPDTARRDLPVVLDGRVWAHAQVGDRIFVGGDFQQVELIDGTVIDQAYIFAYDIDTGVVDPNFRPVVNNVVRSLEAADDGSGLYVGGQFFRWDNSFPIRIARLDAQGNLDTSFQASASAQVLDIVEVGNDLYFVGDFTDVSGVATSGIAKVDADTGAVDSSFTPQLTGLQAGANLARAIVATPDDSSVFVLHFGQLVDGQSREAVAKFDIDGAGNPSLSGWNIPWSAQAGNRVCQANLRDMAISPDGSFIVIGGQGADNPPNCDSVLRYETGGNQTVNFTWSARMYSSVFSLAVSDVAVYVGGHFCAAPLNGAGPDGLTSDFTGTANRCEVNNPDDPLNPSVLDPDNAVFRHQMAALDPDTAQALPWDPGSNNLVGVFDLTLIDRGLLAGHDTDRFSTFLVGRSGFFDLEQGTPDTEAPTFTVTSPADGSVPGTVSELTGLATDNRTVSSITVRLRNITTGEFLQTDGTFAAASADLAVNTNTIALGEVEWSVPINTALPTGNYEVRGFTTDEFGNTSPAVVSSFTIAGDAVCTVELNDQDQPVITLTDFVADDTGLSVIRRNGAWLSNLADGATSFTDENAVPGDYTYEVRWRPNFTVEDVTCSPTVTVPEGGGPGPITVCTVSINGDNSPVLSWDAVAGVNEYVVREAGLAWLATVSDTTYTDAGRAPGTYEYSLRIRMGGVVTDVPCEPTITVPNGGTPTCVAAVNANGEVELTWTAVPGITDYQVRVNGRWLSTENDLAFTDTNPQAGEQAYEIRYRQAGTVNDIACQPTLDI